MVSHSSEEEFHKRLLSTFKREASDHLSSIIEGLLEIERSDFKGDYRKILDRLFRNAHSLKGSSRTVNLLSVEEICQEVEGIFYDIKKEELSFSGPLVEVIHDACVAVEAIVNRPDFPYPYKDIILRLKSLRDLKSEKAVPTKKEARPTEEASKHEIALQALKASLPENLQDNAPSGGNAPISKEEILKINAKRFESLLRQMEELVSVKGFINNNITVISEIEAKTSILVMELKRLCNAYDAGYWRQRGQEMQWGIKDLLEEPMSNLFSIWNTIKTHQRRCLGDQYFINQKTEDILFALKKVVMMPLSLLFESFPRMIRDIAKMQNKQVEAIIEGGEIEVDRRILEEIKDPLVHILRNSIDHGIESLQERQAAGKRPTAVIRIKATLEKGGEIMLKVMDDGRGINIAKLKDRLIKQGVADDKILSAMSDDEVMQYIFRPEISTADIVTTISGRGLGLSIAYEKTGNLGGSISVRSEPSRGTAFIIRLPISVATVKIVVVKSFDGGLYGIPTRNITASLRVRSQDIKTIEGKETIHFAGSAISVISIDETLQINSIVDKQAAWRHFAILHSDGKGIAFSVKEVLHEEEVFLKGFGAQIKRARNFSGAATLSSGITVLIINPSDLIRSALKKGAVSYYKREDIPAARKKKSILIAEDSITARTLFKGILEGAGYAVATAVDGLDAWNALKTNDYDLLVSDVQMPIMNGFELTTRIRNDRKLYSLPVVLITGLETKEDKERGIEAGANAYIVKSSFDQSNLIEVIQRLI